MTKQTREPVPKTENSWEPTPPMATGATRWISIIW